MGMLHAHVSAAQKSRHVVFLLGDKHMLHRCVFFQYRTGAAMCDAQFIHLQASSTALLSSSLPLMCVCTQQLAKFKGSPAMEKLCDDNDIRVGSHKMLLVGHTRSSSRTYYGGTS